MQLKIDLQELDEGIQRYEGLLKDFQDCQSQMESVIMDLGSCWSGVHAAMALIRLAALDRGTGNSLARIQDQTQGILETLEIAREGMNREKNRCDHFTDVVSDAHASTDMQYPDVRQSGSNLLFIDYDRSAALVDMMDSILDNELSLEGRGSGQMGRWKVMFDGIDGQIRHTRLNLRAEDRSAAKNLREQHQKIDNFKQALTRYHMNLAELEKNVSEAFLGYDRYQQEMAVRAIYQTAGPGQETLVMTEQEFLKEAIDGRLLCDWTAIASVLQKKELSAKELAGLCDVLDRIAALPEQERNTMIYTFLSNCDMTSGATMQLFQGYRGTLGLLAAKEPEDIFRYPLSNEAYMMQKALSKYSYWQKNELYEANSHKMDSEQLGTINLKDRFEEWNSYGKSHYGDRFYAHLDWEAGSEEAILTMSYGERTESHTFHVGTEGTYLDATGNLMVSNQILWSEFGLIIDPPIEMHPIRDSVKFGLEVGAIYAGGRLLVIGGQYILAALPSVVTAAGNCLNQPSGLGMKVVEQQMGNGTKALNVLNEGLTWGDVLGLGITAGLVGSWQATVNYAKGTTVHQEGSGAEREAKPSNKPYKNNKEANKQAQKQGYKDAHELKEDYVGKSNVSKYDMKYDTKTGEIYLESKDGKTQIPTGLIHEP